MEETRVLQLRFDKIQKMDSTTKQTSLYLQLQSGLNMYLCAVNANSGRFGLSYEDDGNGWTVDWVLDGEPLFRGDRLIEYNGKFVEARCKEEIRKLVNSSGKCNLVVIRKKTSQQNYQMILQSDNQRLQHRISYLEDQVKELQQSTKDLINVPSQKQKTKPVPNQSTKKGDHVTSINISNFSTQRDSEKPQIFQRGNFVATIIDGKAIQTSSNLISTAFASTKATNTNSPKNPAKSATLKSSIYPKSDSEHDRNAHSQRNGLQHSQSHQQIGPNSAMFDSVPKVSIRNYCSSSQSFLKHKDKSRDHCKENYRARDHSDRHNSQPDLLYESGVSTLILFSSSNFGRAVIEF